MIKVASLLLFFPREVTGMLTHMARAFIGIFFVAMWLVFLLYTQGGPISVVTGASRDIFIPLVQSDGAGRVASPNPPQSSAAQPSEGFAPTHAPPEPPPPGRVRVRARARFKRKPLRLASCSRAERRLSQQPSADCSASTSSAQA